MPQIWWTLRVFHNPSPSGGWEWTGLISPWGPIRISLSPSPDHLHTGKSRCDCPAWIETFSYSSFFLAAPKTLHRLLSCITSCNFVCWRENHIQKLEHDYITFHLINQGSYYTICTHFWAQDFKQSLISRYLNIWNQAYILCPI